MASPDPENIEISADSILALLKDIHPAETAAWWPPAPGWWLLTFITAVVLWWLGNKLLKAWKRYRLKVMARAMLFDLFQRQAGQPRELLAELNQFFKRWLASQGGQNVQYLSSTDWAQHLQNEMNVSAKEVAVIETLTSAQYQSEVPAYDVELLQSWALRWLNLQEVRHG